tara:strand:+ start:347 stop:469 length:123 start_codon:yes stop_codon:yes gene_type:complete
MRSGGATGQADLTNDLSGAHPLISTQSLPTQMAINVVVLA